jgi:hypothetical protein
LLLLTFLVQDASAQWVNHPTPGTPRTRDGKPILTARTPRAPNGKPDLSGVWHVQPTSLEEMKRLFGDDVDAVQVPGMEIDTISKYGINILLDFKPEDAPVRPEVAELLKRRVDGGPDPHPLVYCLPAGVVLSTLLSEVTKIVQTPGLTLIMLELGGTRQIYTDGRKHMADPSPSWLGYSVGKWEGDTLVVDTVGFNGVISGTWTWRLRSTIPCGTQSRSPSRSRTYCSRTRTSSSTSATRTSRTGATWD